MEYLVYKDSDKKIFFEYQYDFNKEYLMFLLSVQIKNFSGEQEFYLYADSVRELTEQLDKIYKSDSGEVTINDSDSESRLTVCMNSINDVRLIGQMGGMSDDIRMSFDTKIDQTSVLLIKNILLSAYSSIT